MSFDHKLFDDMARAMSGAFAGADAVRGEVEARIREQFQTMLGNETVSREEFEAFRELVSQIRTDQLKILERLDQLEQNRKKSAS